MCKEDGKFYKQQWKFFKDLNRNEKVATLNTQDRKPKTEDRRLEWNKPYEYQIYNYSGEMFEITLEDNSSLLVSPEHKVYGYLLPNKISMASAGVTTLSGKHSFKPLSPEKILHPYLRDNATYGTSFKCGDFSTASPALSLKVSKGIISTDSLMNSRTNIISCLESFDRETILSRLLSKAL